MIDLRRRAMMAGGETYTVYDSISMGSGVKSLNTGNIILGDIFSDWDRLYFKYGHSQNRIAYYLGGDNVYTICSFRHVKNSNSIYRGAMQLFNSQSSYQSFNYNVTGLIEGSEVEVKAAFNEDTGETDLNVHYCLNNIEHYDDYSVADSLFQGPTQISIFPVSFNSTSATVGRGYFKNLKIWKEDTLLYDFIPVTRDSDGMKGVLDTVNNKFCFNEECQDLYIMGLTTN